MFKISAKPLKLVAALTCSFLLSLGFVSSSFAETASATSQQPETAAHRLNVNEANLEQLASLPGIGPSKAEAILISRESQGRFNSVEDLQRVKGIGAKTAERLSSLVSF